MGQKTLIYAEDIIYSIMQYPQRTLSKSTIKVLIDEVGKEKAVTVENIRKGG